MTRVLTRKIPLNRVEGDLEVRVDIENGVVVDARSSGTMYRGFENILAGRGPLDGLVITPRICGICSTAHLTAAALALDAIGGAHVPDSARRVRNLALMVEHIQSDMRHGFLSFAPDLANPVYRGHALFDEAVRRYAPHKGDTAIETIRHTRDILEMVAILGGQWPHSAFIVPGGVVSLPGVSELLRCRHLLAGYREWYEHRVLGCSLERWRAVDSAEALDIWLEEDQAHQSSELGFLIRFSRSVGLDRLGIGHGNFVSYGSLDMPADTGVQLPIVDRSPSQQGASQFIPAGFATATRLRPFDQAQVAEHVAHSWFEDYQGGRHPFDGETTPYATGGEGQRYSWAKAPRYQDLPAETGPLAEMVIGGNPLFTSLVEAGGPNVLVRELARLVRPASLLPAMDIWLEELAAGAGEFYQPVGDIEEGDGFGLTEASRGALGHWVKIRDAKITHYQIITPTAWNGSPRDSAGVRGPWEEALIGTEVADADNQVEVQHVIRSFDPCLVCTVH